MITVEKVREIGKRGRWVSRAHKIRDMLLNKDNVLIGYFAPDDVRLYNTKTTLNNEQIKIVNSDITLTLRCGENNEPTS
jgi:hypothetical protein